MDVSQVTRLQVWGGRGKDDSHLVGTPTRVTIGIGKEA